MQFTDRYDAMGIPAPDPDTMCLGPCEGTGYVPINLKSELKEKDDEKYRKAWEEAEAKEPSEDGWHFVTCQSCMGTRLRPGAENIPTRKDKITSSEALFAFMGWLTCRKQKVTFSSVDSAATAADLVGHFCEVNKLVQPRCNFGAYFTMPDDKYLSQHEEQNKQEITIPLSEYEELKENNQWLNHLENSGIDNWQGYEIAQEEYSN